MEHWENSLLSCFVDPKELASRFGVDPEPLCRTAETYPMMIPPHYLSLIGAPGDPIWQQCVPDCRELVDDQDQDPLNEENLSPVPGLIHRYPDRIVWLISSDCPLYCRFCMRKRRLACGARNRSATIAEVVTYLGNHPEVRDILLSGGDPLILADDHLDGILTELRRVPHLDVIRIGTRAPAALPERITPSFCSLLRKHHPIYLNLHFNHPMELTEKSEEACRRLADAGIPLGNQTVLLRGVNDDVATMRQLARLLLKSRVRPYYLHQMDLVRGTAHFRTKISTGLAIIEGMRGHLSGIGVPHYVIDSPGGLGKVPLLPDYVTREGDHLLLRNFRGETVAYRDPEE